MTRSEHAAVKAEARRHQAELRQVAVELSTEKQGFPARSIWKLSQQGLPSRDMAVPTRRVPTTKAPYLRAVEAPGALSRDTHTGASLLDETGYDFTAAAAYLDDWLQAGGGKRP